MLIEARVRTYLLNNVSVPVYVGIPTDRPKKFIAISKTDSSVENHIEMATVEIHSYAETKLEAAELDEAVRGYMELLPESDSDIMACKFGGGNDRPDTAMKSERYRSYFNIYF